MHRNLKIIHTNLVKLININTFIYKSYMLYMYMMPKKANELKPRIKIENYFPKRYQPQKQNKKCNFPFKEYGLGPNKV